jgi:transcriptional regulator with XRE-family HTH domain
MQRASIPDQALMTVFRRLRDERGLSQEAVARRADLTTGAYWRIENLRADPAWSSVKRVAAALEVSLKELAESVEAEKRG